MNSGERFAVLIDSNGIPLTYPNLYTMIYLRNRGHSVNTIVAVLEDIELLYHIFHKLEIDIDKRIEDKKFLNLSEIEAITNLANFKRNYLLARKSNRKILSLPNLKNKEHIRAKFVLKNDYVSKDLIYRRLTNFADYLHWLEVYRSPSSITTTLKVLKNRRPKKAIDQRGDYKSFDQEQLEKILQVVNPSNTECICVLAP